MMSKVSVIIPTYNHQGYVLETLESLWAQTFKDYEVIVINDGSPDNTAELLRPLAKAGRITYIEQPNAGQAAARNRGLAEARGEYIAFLDDDDLWPPNKLQWQVDCLNTRPELSLVGGVATTFEGIAPATGKPRGTTKELPFELFFCGNPFDSPGQTLIRAAALKEVGGFDVSVWGADDLDLYMKLALKGKMEISPAVALFYRVHSGNASKDLKRMMINCRKVACKHLPEVPADRRKEVQDKIDWWLYNYLGRRFIQMAKSEMRAWRLLSACRQMRGLGDLYGRILRNPALAKSFLHDVMPVRLRKQG